MQEDRINEYEKAVLYKAAYLSGLVKEVTIGPGCSSGVSYQEIGTDAPATPSTRARGGRNSTSPGAAGGEESHLQYSNMCVQKLLCDIETERQWQVKAAMKERVERMQELERGQREFLELQLAVARGEGEARRLRHQQALLRQLEEEEAQSREAHARLQQQNQQRIDKRNQEIREAEQRRKDAEEKERQRISQMKEWLDEIHRQQCRYSAEHQQILDAAKKCRDKQALAAKLTGHMSQLRSLNESMEQLIRHCKSSEVSDADVKTGSELVQQITEIQLFIHEEVEKINAKEEEADRRKEQEKRAKSVEKEKQVQMSKLEPAAAAASATAARSNSSEISQFVSPEDLRNFNNLRHFLRQFQSSYTDLLNGSNLKKFRFECQRAVNLPLNSISDVSALHLEDKFVKLTCLLSGKPVEIAGATIVPSRHPQGVPFCQDLLAEKLVHLGELTAKQPKTVFPLAAMVVALWVDFPEFGRLLLVHLYDKCPYLVPMFPPQLDGQSDADYYRSLGYNFSESGEVESQENFLKRMSGIVKLYAAVMVTPVRRRQGKPHPHGLRAAWRWLSAFLNLDPRPDISATVLYEFLEVAGSAMYATYGKQFQKTLHFICKEYLPTIQKISPSSSSGPRVRLETFLQKVLTQGKIPPPIGMLHPNFW